MSGLFSRVVLWLEGRGRERGKEGKRGGVERAKRKWAAGKGRLKV